MTATRYTTNLDGSIHREQIILEHDITGRTPPQQMPGWPKTMGTHPNYKPSGVSLADINGDGYLEIIASSTDGSCHVWDYQGNELTGWPKTGLEVLQAKVAVGDLDLSYPGLEIIAAGRTNTLYAWHSDGTNVSGWPQSVGETGGLKSPVLFDIDGDDTLEVILGQRLYPSGRVLVFRHDGSTYPGWPQSLDYMCVATPSVADVDADSIMEICAVSYYSVYLWDKDGNTKPGWPRLNVAGGMSYAQPVLADLDDDGDIEVLHSYYSSGQNYVGIYDHDAANFPSWPQTYPGPQTYTTPVTADIDGNNLEIFGGGHIIGGPNLSARHHTGVLVSGWPVTVEMLECSPIVFDLDADGDREVLVGDNLSPGSFYAYHGNGTIVTDWPIPTTAATMVNSAAVGDIDQDGDIEIALVVLDGTVNLWTLDSIPYRGYLTDWGTFFHDTWNTGWLHPAPPQNLVITEVPHWAWLSWDANPEPDIAGYNIYRSQTSGGPYVKVNDTLITVTQYYDTPDTQSIYYYYCVTAQIKAMAESRLSNEDSTWVGIAERTSANLSPVTVLPNPFTEHVVFNAPSNAHQTVKIYDVKGSLIHGLEGIGPLSWKPKNTIPAGVYIVKFCSGNKTGFHKIIKLD